MNPRPHFIFLGGFLGAGKTTAVARLARHLADQGLRPAVITNDQGSGLVDTVTLAAQGFATEEIAGGCFCCRFDALLGAAGRLSRAEPPDVIIAEAVGSCTDLSATVTGPLRRIHGERFTVAPLSVLVDPLQARRMLGSGGGDGFSENIRYIYRKQLEEADLIVLNKTDLLSLPALAELQAALAAAFPRARCLPVSLRRDAGLEPWFQAMLFDEQQTTSAMELDYATYAEGEARLGWLNATAAVAAETPFDPGALLSRFAREIQARLDAVGAAVAHLKLTLQPADAAGPGLAAVNLVWQGAAPEPGRNFGRRISHGRMLINLRAEAAPETLTDAVKGSLERFGDFAPGLCVKLDVFDSFRPGKPQPTHCDRPAIHAGVN